MDRSTKQKISKDTQALNDIVDQLDLNNIKKKQRHYFANKGLSS